MFRFVCDILLLSAVTANASGFDLSENQDLRSRFDEWKKVYKKKYATLEEEKVRLENWIENLKKVVLINEAWARGESTWNADQGPFADLTVQEMKEKVLMNQANKRSSAKDQKTTTKTILPRSSATTLPTSFDWRDNGAVTSVKDQGSVGTCWAFSTVGNVEGQYAIKNKKLVDLSVEYLVDCDGSSEPESGHADCSVFGGWPYLAYDFIIKSKGLPTWEQDPYCVGTGDCYPCMQGPVSLCGPPPFYCNETITASCKSMTPFTTISSWATVEANEDAVADALVTYGPLSIIMDATQLSYYKGGIWSGHISGEPAALGCHNDFDSTNHAVLLVGYGVEGGGQPYWVVKNSWGQKWGEEGYFRIAKSSASLCAIYSDVTTSLM